MSTLTYFIAHILAIIVPGYIIIKLMRPQSGKFLFVLASGYIFYVLLAALSKWQAVSLVSFAWFYGGTLACLAIAAVLQQKRHQKTTVSRLGFQEDKQEKRLFILGLFLVAGTYLIYRFIVGPYDEIPADVYRHLEYTREQLSGIENGFLGTDHDVKALLKQQGGIWYSFYALISWASGTSLSKSMPSATLANGLIFLSAVYGFAWYLFGHFKITPLARLAASLLSVFFLSMHLGLNVFAYLRYYSLAPTMLNMVIYFALSVAILELLQWRKPQIAYIIFVPLGTLAAGMVHNQEALFVAIMGGLMLAWFALSPRKALINSAAFGIQRPRRIWPYRFLLLIAIISFLGMEVWVYTHLQRPEHFANKVLQLSEGGAIFSRILYLNPLFQGIEVVTIWGLMVYAVFVFYWRRFIVHPYLFMGMLLPIFTVFNPLFVDWFLRLDGVHTLWRMLYILPLHFVAGLAVVFLFQTLRKGAVWRKIIAALSLVALFSLLLPLGGLNPNSRLTLAAVDADESYTHWGELIEFLNRAELGKTSILTDPVTGYVLNGLSKHRTYQYKFLDDNSRPFNFEHYDDAPLKQYKNWLLIVNDRGGGLSETGRDSKHWNENILNTAPYYSEPLRQHIKLNPDKRFTLLWERDGIRVFEITGVLKSGLE